MNDNLFSQGSAENSINLTNPLFSSIDHFAVEGEELVSQGSELSLEPSVDTKEVKVEWIVFDEPTDTLVPLAAEDAEPVDTPAILVTEELVTEEIVNQEPELAFEPVNTEETEMEWTEVVAILGSHLETPELSNCPPVTDEAAHPVHTWPMPVQWDVVNELDTTSF